MPGQQFGHRMQHNIGTVIEWAIGGGRGKGIIHHQQNATPLRHIGDCGHIGDPEGRV